MSPGERLIEQRDTEGDRCGGWLISIHAYNLNFIIEQTFI